MRPSIPLVLGALTLAACGTLQGHEAPGCHGARRPANPHGSVLAQGAVDAGSAIAPAAAPAGACGKPAHE